MNEHGVGPETEFMVTDDDAEALDRALFQPAPDAAEDIRFGNADAFGDQREGPDEQRQPFLQHGNQPALGFVHQCNGLHRLGGGDTFLLVAVQAETEVDVELFEQRQRHQRVAGGLLDGAQAGLQTPLAGGRDDEPQVVAVLAFVVVIDLGEAIDRSGNRRQLFRRYGHRRQCRGADALRGEDGADPRNLAFTAQVFEPAEDDLLAHPQACRQFGEGRRAEREVALEVVEELEVEGVVHQKPMRAAREVKKMPEGLSAAISPSLAKFSVL